MTHGKTEAGIVWLTYGIENPRYRALVIRKNADDLSDWVDRARRFYTPLGADFAYRPAIITFPSGAVIRTGHLKDAQAYTKYQGHEYHKLLIEELTQIPDEKRYLQILASCRSTVTDLKPFVFLTSNPGGLGNSWVKKRFVDPAPAEKVFKRNKLTRAYIPATIDDNPVLKEKDPNYILQLDALKETDIDLWKAWRHGNWDTFAGQFFREFDRNQHVVARFSPKSDLPKYGGVDWGRTAPFCFLACAFEKVTWVDPRNLRESEFNRVHVYRELYGTEKLPHEWARKIKGSVDLNEFVEPPRGDPKMFHKLDDGSRSIASQFQEEGVVLSEANNDRLAGWEAVKNWLSIAPDGLPYLLIGEQCENLIRTLPEQVYDEKKPEDLDTTGEDHCADTLRYCLIHIKWIDAKTGTVQRPQPRDQSVKKTIGYVSIDAWKE